MQLKQRILETLGRFTTIEYASLKEEVLRGSFDYAAEKDFDRDLTELRLCGQVGNRDWFGPWWLAPAATEKARTGLPSPKPGRAARRT